MKKYLGWFERVMYANALFCILVLLAVWVSNEKVSEHEIIVKTKDVCKTSTSRRF